MANPTIIPVRMTATAGFGKVEVTFALHRRRQRIPVFEPLPPEIFASPPPLLPMVTVREKIRVTKQSPPNPEDDRVLHRKIVNLSRETLIKDKLCINSAAHGPVYRASRCFDCHKKKNQSSRDATPINKAWKTFLAQNVELAKGLPWSSVLGRSLAHAAAIFVYRSRNVRSPWLKLKDFAMSSEMVAIARRLHNESRRDQRP